MPPTASGAPQAPKTAIPAALQPTDAEKEGLKKLFSQPSETEARLKDTMGAIEEKERREAMGLDLDFDVEKLVTAGIIEKKGIRVPIPDNLPKLYVDMHTLTTAETTIAERLVAEVFKPDEAQPADNTYYNLKRAAVVAMSVTRCNNDMFPVPPTDLANRGTEEFKTAFEKKRKLFETFYYKFPEDWMTALSFIYAKLDLADMLIEEDARKKSSRP